jgi:hypothetical protein
MSNLNQLYRKYTGILTDVEGAIAAAKTEQEKRDLYNKLTWRIPGGLVRKNYKDLLDELAARLIDSVSPVPETPSTVIVEETHEEAPVEAPAEEPVVDECPLYEEAPVDEAATVVEETPAVVETPTRRSRSSKVVEE